MDSGLCCLFWVHVVYGLGKLVDAQDSDDDHEDVLFYLIAL